jgi:integrase
MVKHNEKNARIKRRYTQYLAEAKRQAEASVDKALAAIDRFENFNRRRDFMAFHVEQAIAFKARLVEELNPATGKPLSKGTVTVTLKALRKFFLWLADQPGFRSKLRYTDADYFNASNRDRQIARDAEQRPSPSLDQAHYVLERMPSKTDIEKRNRAIFALLILTSVRDGAVVGLKLRHVNLADCSIRQDARYIKTKFSKTMTTWFFPVGGQAEAIFVEYVQFLREEKLWSPDDPLFPKTKMGKGPSGGFTPVGLDRAHWAGASAIRKIVKAAFEAHGMPTYGPHSFRKTLARLGQEVCQTPEEMKAWSQNLDHEDVMTTFRSYGQVQDDRQRQVLAGLRAGKAEE